MECHGTPPQPRSSKSKSTNTDRHDNSSGGWGILRRASAASSSSSSTSSSTSSSFSAAAAPSTAAVVVGPRSNRQEVIVEIYEHERWSRKADAWIPSEAPRRAHWCTAQGTPSPAPEEMVPPVNFGWVSNWRVDTSASSSAAPLKSSSSISPNPPPPSRAPSSPPPPILHDRQGWEYATAPDKFHLSERQPRGEERWSDRARRRRWIRLAKYKTLLPAMTPSDELGKQAQQGLKGLVRGRRAVQELCKLIGTRRDSREMREKVFSLVEIIRQHGKEIEQVLENLREREGGREGGVGGGVKKWGNDLGKEQRVFEDVAREVERKCRSVPLAALPDAAAAAAAAGAQRGTTGAAAAAAAGAGAAGGAGAGGASQSSSNYIGDVGGGCGGGGGGAVAATERLVVSAGRDSFRPFVNLEGKVQDQAHHHTEEEQAILKQLEFQDEEEVMLALALERELAINEVTTHLVELRGVFKEFAQLVSEQQEGIDAVCRNADDAHARTEEGYNAILKAKEGQKENTGCMPF